MLNGMNEYVQRLTTLPVMYGSHAPWLTEDTPDEYCAPNYSSLVGTLLLGSLYRETHPELSDYNHDWLKRLKNFKENAQTSILDIFTEQY